MSPFQRGVGETSGKHPSDRPNGHPATNGHAVAPSARAPRILILCAGVGAGHFRAAEAIEQAARRLRPDAIVRNIDVLSLATWPFRRCYGEMYLDFVNAAPGVLGFFYNLMDQPGRATEQNSWDRLRIFLEMRNLCPFLELLHSEPWDVVINTHFLSGEIIGSLRRQGQFSAPQVMVTTDFETHRLWVTEPCELYFTATEEGAAYMEKQGLPPGKTRVVGIPIHPVFAEPKDRAACLARHGLRGDRRIVLQLSGGYGVGRIEELHRALLEVDVPTDLVVVTGRNAEAKKTLESLPSSSRHRVHVLGYTHHMEELLAVADLVVSKPGGLTTSEALAMGVPLAVVDPVPGQEERNSDYLLENGAAIKINHLPTLALKVSAILRDPARLAQLRAHARRLGRPRAAFDIVEQSLALVQPPPAPQKSAEPPVAHPAPTPRREPEPAARPEAEPVGAMRRTWHAARTWFDVASVGLLHLFARVWHGCTRTGTLELPATGPAIVIANHPNYSDPAFLTCACLRPLAFLHARESFSTPVLYRLFRRFGSIPVARTGHDVGAVRAALGRLRAGEAVCVFPEGEVTTSGLPIGPPKHGAAYLALRSKAPVYPVHITGGRQSGQILRDWLWPAHGVRVSVGSPVDLAAYFGRPLTHTLLAEVTALLMRRIAALAPVPEPAPAPMPAEPEARLAAPAFPMA